MRAVGWNEEGLPIGIIGMTRDITERKSMEEEKKSLEAQFETADRMKAIGTLAGGIAHDFNNLLMGIQGNAVGRRTLHQNRERIPG